VTLLAQPLLAGLDERASDAGTPMIWVDVDGVELAISFFVIGAADRDEPDDLVVELRDDGWVAAMHLCALLDGECGQPLARQRVGVGDLPAADLHSRDRFSVSRCAGADHSAEPTLAAVKRIVLLGATGSIGRQALDIIDAHPELELVAAASGSQRIDGVAPLTQVGGDLTQLLERAKPDLVLNAVVGFAGLPATLWALEHGVDLALANKESLVAAGDLALAAHERGGGRLIPVDSEHSAAFQCLEGRDADQVHSLVLTASGGPFRGRTRGELEDVTPAEALAHPTWNMGPKITVDSATLANKGLELIEAHFLFRLGYEQIEVVVHPSSTVHALVRFRDGASLAHLGYPDMRVPISYALTYPDRAATPVPPLDLSSGVTLEFHAPDLDTFPLLELARRAGERGGNAPCIFNAANEVAVGAFLEGRLPFLGIGEVVADALDTIEGASARDLEELIAVDAAARRHAAESQKVA
jgi:1-deoxy-D-xylulose-5-phosphate reductoisomerase